MVCASCGAEWEDCKIPVPDKASGNEKNNIIFFKIVHIVISTVARSNVNESQL